MRVDAARLLLESFVTLSLSSTYLSKVEKALAPVVHSQWRISREADLVRNDSYFERA
jgi:hypothetical protein